MERLSDWPEEPTRKVLRVTPTVLTPYRGEKTISVQAHRCLLPWRAKSGVRLFMLRCIRPPQRQSGTNNILCARMDHNIFMKQIGSIVVMLNHLGFFFSCLNANIEMSFGEKSPILTKQTDFFNKSWNHRKHTFYVRWYKKKL